MWLSSLSTDGTLTRLASTGDTTTLSGAVRILEYLAARPAEAPPVALPALAAHVTGDTKALNPSTTLATLVMRALALREGVQGGDTAITLKGDPVPTPWEPELRETMRTTGRAIYEETVADQLLADLSAGWF